MEAATLKLTAREERIETLLSWWIDVLEGWQEMGRGADGMGVKMMSRAWNSRSYQELERCLRALRDEDNRTYWHVRERWLTGGRRSVYGCPKCDKTCEVAARHLDTHGNIKRQCKHGETVFWVLKSVPHVSAAVDPVVVAVGVRWLAARFTGEPFVPDELLAKERAA